MIARFLKPKGVFQYCKCAELVKQHLKAEFMYLGNQGSVKVEDIKEYIYNIHINYLGIIKEE